ncbi:hypothetical protein Tsp_08013 [Trichinella spiralis]|uniref:hypothetical protein n=1 Tax=Trichinella spiralis TaxID=6334 RepID=UPI0001EFDD3D|nr:hypothetical protein Tsp_08013 [Trichinella spiralis]
MDQNVLHLLKAVWRMFLKQFIFKNDAHAIHMVGQFLLDRHDVNTFRQDSVTAPLSANRQFLLPNHSNRLLEAEMSLARRHWRSLVVLLRLVAIDWSPSFHPVVFRIAFDLIPFPLVEIAPYVHAYLDRQPLSWDDRSNRQAVEIRLLLCCSLTNWFVEDQHLWQKTGTFHLAHLDGKYVARLAWQFHVANDCRPSCRSRGATGRRGTVPFRRLEIVAFDHFFRISMSLPTIEHRFGNLELLACSVFVATIFVKIFYRAPRRNSSSSPPSAGCFGFVGLTMTLMVLAGVPSAIV